MEKMNTMAKNELIMIICYAQINNHVKNNKIKGEKYEKY